LTLVNKPENYPDLERIFIQYAGESPAYWIEIRFITSSDESYFQPGLHGNAKSDEVKNTIFVRTLPSLINKMKECLQNKNLSEFYMSQSQQAKGQKAM